MMERTLCVWYPAWALRRPDVSPDVPAQAVDESSIVVAVSSEASRAGVTVGMRRREAEAVCPTVTTVIRDAAMEHMRFEPVVSAIEQLVPRVEVVEPGMVFVPTGGAVDYYGGEGFLVDRVVKELDAFGGDLRIGLAAGPFAAMQAVRRTTEGTPFLIVDDDAAFIEQLDVSAVGSDDLAASLRWLGITTLGELASLPRDAVVARFGRTGMDAHRLANGLGRRVLPRAIPADARVRSEFDPPLEDFDRASFAARSLAQQLIRSLAAGGTAPYRVVVTATAGDGEQRVRTWRSTDPFDDRSLADRVRWQLRSWIEGVGVGVRGGIVAIEIEPADLSGDGRQLALAEDAKAAAETQRALVEVQAIEGPDSVMTATAQGGRDPAARIRWVRWGDETGASTVDGPWPGRIEGPTPALVPPEPVPFEVSWSNGMPEQVRLRSRWVPVLSWAGPWRNVGRWWEGAPSSDRYQIVTSTGAYLCEVIDGATYLIGVYD